MEAQGEKASVLLCKCLLKELYLCFFDYSYNIDQYFEVVNSFVLEKLGFFQKFVVSFLSNYIFPTLLLHVFIELESIDQSNWKGID